MYDKVKPYICTPSGGHLADHENVYYLLSLFLLIMVTAGNPKGDVRISYHCNSVIYMFMLSHDNCIFIRTLSRFRPVLVSCPMQK